MPDTTVLLFVTVLAIVGVYFFWPTGAGNRSQRAKLSRDIARSLGDAEEAARDCLGMCSAVGTVDRLAESDRTVLSVVPGVWDGPRDSDLLLEKRAASKKALGRCRRVAVDGLKVTRESCFVVLRAVLLSAEAACRECHPDSGQEECPALRYLEQASEAVDSGSSTKPQGGRRRRRRTAEPVSAPIPNTVP